MNRFEKVIAAVEKHQMGQMEETNRQLDDFKREMLDQRNDADDALKRQLESVTVQMKAVESELGKCQYDWRERADGLAQEMKANEVYVNSQLANLKDLLQNGDSNIDARLQVTVSKLTETVRYQIEDQIGNF